MYNFPLRNPIPAEIMKSEGFIVATPNLSKKFPKKHIRKLSKSVESMSILLSIKPKYVNEILKETKTFEFRKTIFKQKGIMFALIYSSSPVKKIVAEFKIGKIYESSPKILWKKYQNRAGVTEKEFFKYFEGKEQGYAIEIKDLRKFSKQIDPKTINPEFRAPQSFSYIDLALYSKFTHIGKVNIENV